jgi:hypothetical protein
LNPWPRPYQGRALPLSYSSEHGLPAIKTHSEKAHSTTLTTKHKTHNKQNRNLPTKMGDPTSTGAGEGNRTLTTSLEGWGSTVELHPLTYLKLLENQPEKPVKKRSIHIQVGEAGFEPAKALPLDLQSSPFGHSGIPPQKKLFVAGSPSRFVVKHPADQIPAWT